MGGNSLSRVYHCTEKERVGRLQKIFLKKSKNSLGIKLSSDTLQGIEKRNQAAPRKSGLFYFGATVLPAEGDCNGEGVGKYAARVPQ